MNCVWKCRSSCPAGRASSNQHGMQIGCKWCIRHTLSISNIFSRKIRQHIHPCCCRIFCSSMFNADEHVQNTTLLKLVSSACLQTSLKSVILWLLFSFILCFVRNIILNLLIYLAGFLSFLLLCQERLCSQWASNGQLISRANPTGT